MDTFTSADAGTYRASIATLKSTKAREVLVKVILAVVVVGVAVVVAAAVVVVSAAVVE
ncbi:hypothetical protein ElyMa_006802400 [Elysia marginata]|uniref:Uncharacterized protein n=1 Tax=Elysia marginata TaxID=1093978 RepID=A0AAV4J2V6_9GAST|nr:hypothetical protein ElyMa_006802400 [Elysia marginata]